MNTDQPKGIGLAALEGKEYVGYKEIAEATGLQISTLYGYHNADRGNKTQMMPKSDKPGAWRADRQDLRDWITRESRPGQGARIDIYRKQEQDEETTND